MLKKKDMEQNEMELTILERNMPAWLEAGTGSL